MLKPTQKVEIACTVNGKEAKWTSYPMARLLDVLREDLHLTGTKEGCGEGECGACSVWVNDELVNSCLVPAAQMQGARIRTIEGLAPAQGMHPLQESFLKCGGAQCGICTPGMLMAAAFLLEKRVPANGGAVPTGEEIRTALSGNLCRCTGYTKIFESVACAAAASPTGNSRNGGLS